MLSKHSKTNNKKALHQSIFSLPNYVAIFIAYRFHRKHSIATSIGKNEHSLPIAFPTTHSLVLKIINIYIGRADSTATLQLWPRDMRSPAE